MSLPELNGHYLGPRFEEPDNLSGHECECGNWWTPEKDFLVAAKLHAHHLHAEGLYLPGEQKPLDPVKVEVIQLEPADVIIVHLPRDPTKEHHEMLMRRFAEIWPHNQVITVGPQTEFEIIRQPHTVTGKAST